LISYSFQAKAKTAWHLERMATGLVKVLPEGQIRLGPVGLTAAEIAVRNFKQRGTTTTYFPKQDLFVVIRHRK
jgi:hypothetical protein